MDRFVLQIISFAPSLLFHLQPAKPTKWVNADDWLAEATLRARAHPHPIALAGNNVAGSSSASGNSEVRSDCKEAGTGLNGEDETSAFAGRAYATLFTRPLIT